jgi:hypothetical protein
MEDQLTAQTMKLNESAPPGFLASGKSLINEVEKLRVEVNTMREALLRLIDVLQRQSETAVKEEAA